MSVQILTKSSYLAKLLKKDNIWFFFQRREHIPWFKLQELQNDPVTFPFGERIKATYLRKSYL